MAVKNYPVTKDGIQFEVRASSKEEAAQKAKELDTATTPRLISRKGTTRVFERPNGQRYLVSPGFSSSNPQAIEQALSGMSAEEISRGSIERGLIEQYPIASRASEVMRSVPFIGSRLDVPALSGAMQRQRPGESLALNIAGGALSTLAPAGVIGAIPRAGQALSAAGQVIVGTGSRAAQMARAGGAGAVAGGAEGAIYGSGEGATPEESIEEAKTGAAFGAATGGLFGLAAPVVEAGVRNVMSLFRRSDIDQIAREFNISKNSARVLKNTFDMGGGLEEGIQRLERAGAEGMVADAGPASQALLDAVAASGPAASAAARGPIEQRMAATQGRLETGLTGLLGEPAEGPVTAVEEIMARTRTQRGERYAEAYETPIDYSSDAGRKIESIMFDRVEPNVLMDAVSEANAQMRDLGMPNQQIMATIADDGTVKFQEMPNVRQADELKKALNALARKAKNTEGVVSVETPQSIRYAKQARDLADALKEATGGDQGTYAKAVKVGGDTIQERNAYEFGERLLSPSTRIEEVRLELGANPSQAQLEAARRGLRTRIDKIVGDVKEVASDRNIDARQAIATLREMSSNNARTKIRRLMGDQADDIFAMLDEASIAAETRAAMAANSRTAIRQAAQEDIAQMAGPGPVGEALRGEPINTTKALIQAVTGYTDEFTVEQRQRIYQDLARALTEKRGPEAQMALRVLQQAMSGQQLTDQQTEMLARLITISFAASAAPSIGRETATQFGQ